MTGRTPLLLVAALLMISVFTKAQSTACDSDALNDTLLKIDPVFKRSFQYLQQKLMQQEQLSPSDRTNDIYTLPVVVHVIHKGEPYGTGTNITDEQIFSAITALNQDYRHLPGTNGYGDGPDIGIEFCLASRNPNGQPTNGINRVNGSTVANYATMGIEASAGNGASEESVKALSTWPRTSYLNIWVVTEIENNDGGSGIQGYAYFPFNSPIDGVVVLYNAIGTSGNLKSYTNMNRTMSHEVGHYLGLYHTFHDTDACDTELNCQTDGDRVCDTPETILNTTCSVPACSGTQQVENYMDYTNQTCQNMFSEGQKLRMRTTLETQRASMITSMGCMPVFTRDTGITSIVSPTGTNCAGAFQPQVTLANFGSATLTSVTINYNIDGSGNNTYNWTGSLSAGTSAVVTLNSITPTGGSHTLYAWTSNPNGQSDQNTSNDQSTGAFSVSTGATATIIVTLDYFGSETTWQITNEANDILLSGGPYVDNQQGLQITEPVCLEAGCYTLTFFDEFGDGQSFTTGNFVLKSPTNETLISVAGNTWDDFSANDFCLVAPALPPVASLTIEDNTICKNTQIDFSDTSTNTPTSWSWTFEGGIPATSTTQNPQNINYPNAGTYDVTLVATNANGSNTYVCPNCVTVYGTPNVTLTPTAPACANGTNGSIISAVSGTAPYIYSWNTGAATANLSGIAAGNYTLTVTDANSCTKATTAAVTNPTGLTITGTSTNNTCNGVNNGSITVTASGGTGNKTITWSNGSNGATINNLAAGSYTATATDQNGCTASQSFTITAPAAITITNTTTQPSCFGSTNGSITVSSTGGTGNKTYNWNTGATGATLSNLGNGVYTVTATDANGCTKTASYTITAPAAVNANHSDFDIACSNLYGSAQVSPTGGTAPYTTVWSTGTTGSVVNSLAAGNYSVTVTDSNGCTDQESFSIVQSTSLNVYIDSQNIECNNSASGSATAIVSGGSGIYEYVWSNGATTSSINSLEAGLYSLIVSDSEGCQGSAQAVITQPEALSLAVFKTDISCFGENDGTGNATATGGIGPYTYEWDNGSMGSSVTDLSEGLHSVTAIDNNGCSVSESIIIVEPSMLTASIIVTTFETCVGNDGSAVANIMGGTPGYFISWSDGSSGQMLNEVASGDYQVTITDANGCQLSGSIEIPYNCTLNIPTTQLVEGDCGNMNLTESSLISCDVAEGAEMYMWRFAQPNGMLISDEYSLSNVFYVSQIPELEAGAQFSVSLKVMIDNNWGAFGNTCLIGIESVIQILPSLTLEDCGSTIVDWGETLIANEYPEALSYQWHITGPDYDWTTFSDINVLVLDANMLFEEGETYAVELRCSLGGGEFTPWGPSCNFTIALGINIGEFPQTNGTLLVYPNPCDGQNIYFDFGNLSNNTTVEDLRIYSSNGALVENIVLNDMTEKSAPQAYRFRHPLSPGIYVLRYSLDGKICEEKLVVR